MPTAGRTPRGADRLTAALEAQGATHVYGMPGTQNVTLFDALRRSSLRTVVATHEMAAGFMAIGHARVTGRPGVLATIPGPGFTFALSALAEARLDSVPLVHLCGAPARVPGRRFPLQALDQRAMAEPMVKAVLEVESAADVADATARAFALACQGEPGPVLLHLAAGAMTEDAPEQPASVSECSEEPLPGDVLDAIAARLQATGRVLLHAGQGTLDAPDLLARLATRLGALVVTTTSARGVVPEDAAFVVVCDSDAPRLNALVREADLVLSLGVKFSHNAAAGFGLDLPGEKLIAVDAGAESLDAGYASTLSLQADVPRVLRALLERIPEQEPESRWSEATLAHVRALHGAQWPIDPHLGESDRTPAQFFGELRDQLPSDAVLLTDSGLHQMLARRYFTVVAPRTFVLPTNFQSMGFGIPAAIGAAMAQPQRRVAVVVGDGSLALSGMELLTAVRERLPLLVIAFVDGHLGLIRNQQLGAHGHPFGTELHNPEFSGWAQSLGLGYVRYRDARSLAHALTHEGPVLLDVRLHDTPALHARRVRTLGRETALHLFGHDALRWLRRKGGRK